MKTMLTALSTALAAGTVFLAMPTEAHALGPVDIEVGAKVGFATSPDSASPINPYGFGVGARGGVSFFGIYVGANLMYYTGGSTTEQLGTSSLKFSEHTLQYGLEAGYGFNIAILTIRPQVGFGNLSFGGSASGADVTSAGSTSTSHFYVEPGLTALVSLGLIYVGADVNVLLVPGVDTVDTTTGAATTKTYASPTFHAQVGVKF